MNSAESDPGDPDGATPVDRPATAVQSAGGADGAGTARRRLVSTGLLPHVDVVDERIREAHERYCDVTDGHVADYIPALANASADWFGIAVCSVAGVVRTVGDADTGTY